jgi:hypothetical protein
VQSATHSYDTGTASGFFTLQALRMGWLTHGMTGIDRRLTHRWLQIPSGYVVEAAYAVGRLGDPALLPEELRACEVPSGREPLHKLAFEGFFPDEP